MKRKVHTPYKDRRGWTCLVLRVVDEWGTEKPYWRICFHKKGTPNVCMPFYYAQKAFHRRAL